ncbi:MAG: NAD(P)-dependent dehydrogenase (short-subunit alcohol dehydrogenase family), partial [Myxococcota bacterium]
MRVDQTVALVTGGASGLGEACVRMLVENGGKAVILDVNQERGDAVAAELGDAVRFIKTDVSNAEQVQAAVDLAKEAFGTITAAINCAGIGTVGRTVGRKGPLPLEIFERTIRVNLIGTFNVARLAAAAMAEN